MKISYQLTLREFFSKLVQYLSPITGPISPVEEKILFQFLILPSEKFKYNRFSTLGRRKVLHALNQTEHISVPNINNRIYDLCKKKVIVRDEDNLMQVVPSLSRPFEAFQRGVFNLNIQFENKDNQNPT